MVSVPNTDTLTKVKSRGNIASWSIHSTSYGPLCGRLVMGHALIPFNHDFQVKFCPEFLKFQLDGGILHVSFALTGILGEL